MSNTRWYIYIDARTWSCRTTVSHIRDHYKLKTSYSVAGVQPTITPLKSLMTETLLLNIVLFYLLLLYIINYHHNHIKWHHHHHHHHHDIFVNDDYDDPYDIVVNDDYKQRLIVFKFELLLSILLMLFIQIYTNVGIYSASLLSFKI